MAAGGTVLGTPPASTSVPVYTQETPAIQRNMAMRAGTGLGLGSAPTTPGSARRVSGDMRGRRGSSIGNGFEGKPAKAHQINTKEAQNLILKWSYSSSSPVIAHRNIVQAYQGRRPTGYPLSNAGDVVYAPVKRISAAK